MFYVQRHRRAIFARFLFVFLFGWLILTACASSPTPDSFEKVIGAKLDPQIQLVTNRTQYREPQAVGYEVLNYKGIPIYFSDYTFGVRAYTYDQQSQQWSLFHWNFGLIDPKPITIPSGPHKPAEHTYVLGLQFMPSESKVRLVVVGWTDPNNPEGSKIAAYADIEIVR